MTALNYIVEAINADDINAISSVYKLMLSLLLGALVGYERKKRGQSAGVRTFSLIAMGAALSMILSVYVPQQFSYLRGDATRIAAQVVSGIGFLGAGAIIQMKGSVRGLTTAAGIWMVAAIGMAVGAGMYVISLIATFLIYFILVQLERIEHRVTLGSESRVIRMHLATIVDDIAPYETMLKTKHVTLTHYYIEHDYVAQSTHLNLTVLAREDVNYLNLFKDLRTIYPTNSITLATQLTI
jgi:putative Mg2+ transporter-C (MgtC) family protein